MFQNKLQDLYHRNNIPNIRDELYKKEIPYWDFLQFLLMIVEKGKLDNYDKKVLVVLLEDSFYINQVDEKTIEYISKNVNL